MWRWAARILVGLVFGALLLFALIALFMLSGGAVVLSRLLSG